MPEKKSLGKFPPQEEIITPEGGKFAPLPERELEDPKDKLITNGTYSQPGQPLPPQKS